MRVLFAAIAVLAAFSAHAQEVSDASLDGDDWRGRTAILMMVNDQPDDDADPLTAPFAACRDTACDHYDMIVFGADEAAHLREVFAGDLDGAGERAALSRATGLAETFIGRRNGTLIDRPGNDKDFEDQPGQLDCISESVNTHTLMIRLELAGLLKRHRVGGMVRRYSLILQHQAVLIQDLADGAEFVVDSWVGAGGEPAVVEPYAEWRNRWAV